jgi:hypothetical protein
MNTTYLTIRKGIRGNAPAYKSKNTFLGSGSVAPGLLRNDKVVMKFDREFLFEYCKRDNNRDIELLIAILSLGGMRIVHGNQLFANSNWVLKIVFRLRKGEFRSREEAFNEILEIRSKGILPGMGIGYFLN